MQDANSVVRLRVSFTHDQIRQAVGRERAYRTVFRTLNSRVADTTNRAVTLASKRLAKVAAGWSARVERCMRIGFASHNEVQRKTIETAEIEERPRPP